MDEEKKIILVTGGSGLVGNGLKSVIKTDGLSSYFIKTKKSFRVKWIFLSSKDGDLSDLYQTELLFKEHRPTHVIHLAAMVGGVFYNMKANLDFFRKNMLINDNVLQMCFKYNVQKVISCLSSCIFPHEIHSYPLTENMMHNGKPHISNFGYSYAKRMIDIMNQAYQDFFDKNEENRLFTSIVPCNVYGPHDNFDLEKGHVIPNLIHKAYLQRHSKREHEHPLRAGPIGQGPRPEREVGPSGPARRVHCDPACPRPLRGGDFVASGPLDPAELGGVRSTQGSISSSQAAQARSVGIEEPFSQEFKLAGTGKARRQFIYSTDLGKLLIWAIFNYEEREPIILSVDEQDEISIHDVAQIILKLMNLDKQITYDDVSEIANKNLESQDGQIKKTVSNAKLKKYLPDFKFTPIEIGITNTIEWFENNSKIN